MIPEHLLPWLGLLTAYLVLDRLAAVWASYNDSRERRMAWDQYAIEQTRDDGFDVDPPDEVSE